MNIKLGSNEDFTFTTKGGYTVTVPNENGTIATTSDIYIDTVKVNGTALTPDANKAVDIPVLVGVDTGNQTPTLCCNVPNTAGFSGVYGEDGASYAFGPENAQGFDYVLATTDQIPTESTVSGWGFTKNAGTVTSVKMNGTTNNPTSGVVDLGTVITSETSLSKGTTSGNGNAVTDISVSGHQITLTKGSTFLTSETSLSKGTTTGSGNAVTDISVSGHQITLTKGSTFLTSYTETDPVFSASAAAGISSSDITAWNAKQKAITVSTSEPTSGQGSNGDIWIVI